MCAKTLYLQNQVLAHETSPVFSLELDRDGLDRARAAGVEAGSMVSVVDAAQDYFCCEVVSFDDDALMARIAPRYRNEVPRPRVHLVQGVSDDEAMTTIVKQVTEIGVDDIVPFHSAFSPVTDTRKSKELVGRWRQMAQYSARQAGRDAIPTVHEVVGIEEVPSLLASFDAVFLCWEDEKERTIADALSSLGDIVGRADADIALLIGPRGGLTDEEMAVLGDCNKRLFTVSLGPSILRVETASLVAPTLLIYALGGLR